MQVPFAIHSYRSRSLPLSAQRLVNLFAEQGPPRGKNFVVLHGTPGLKKFAESGDGPTRGLHAMAGTLYQVSGSDLYSVFADGTTRQIGNIPGSGRVDMADNGTELVVVSPNEAFVYNRSTDKLEQITDPDFAGAGTVDYLDGFFVFSEPGSGRFFISGLFEGTQYDALDFATAEIAPDDTLAVFVDHRELLVFGERTVEVWFNSGNATFPFERRPGGIMEQGCAVAGSIAKLDNSVYWLGDDLVVYRLDGLTPVRVSTHAVEFAIQGYADKDGEAFTYSQEGHKFYVLSFPEGTWALDAATGLWHERESVNEARWRAQCYATAYGRRLVGDFENGKVYELDLDTYTEDGATIRRVAASAPLGDDVAVNVMSRFQLVLETGVGKASGQGSDPQVMLDFSDDGGRTWSNERWVSAGKVGAYRHRAIWRRLGGFRSRVMRVAISDPVKVAIISADAEPGVPVLQPQLEPARQTTGAGGAAA